MQIKQEETKVFIKELARTVFFLALVVIIVRFFILQPFVVIGMSMEPTYQDNNYLFVNELTYHFADPKRGDVVIFRHPENVCNAFVNSNWFNRTFRQGPCTNYIKRIIGLPGETVVIKNGTVTVKNQEHPEGLILNENYVEKGVKLQGDETLTLAQKEYFVLGDNRLPQASSDSREWGVLPRQNIIGKSWLRVIPFNKFGFAQNPGYSE